MIPEKKVDLGTIFKESFDLYTIELILNIKNILMTQVKAFPKYNEKKSEFNERVKTVIK